MKKKAISLAIEEALFILYLFLIGTLFTDAFPSLSGMLLFGWIIAGAIAVCKVVEILIMPLKKRRVTGIGVYELAGYFLFWCVFLLDYLLLDHLGFRGSMSLLVPLSLISAVWQMAISYVLDQLVGTDWKALKDAFDHYEDIQDE